MKQNKTSMDCAEPRSTIAKMRPETGVFHATIFPGKMSMSAGGSPYHGNKAAASGPKPLGRPVLLASKDPMAIRTSGSVY
jgi:hypothetical protein